MRRALLILVCLLAACGSGKSDRKPQEPMLAIVHTDPTTFVDGGPLASDQIERRELRCGRPNSTDVTLPLPDDGRLTVAQLLASVPGVNGVMVCRSVVYVDGVVSRESNEVRFNCNSGFKRCWKT